MTDLTGLSLAQLRSDIAEGRISPEDVVAAHRDRVEVLDPRLRAFTELVDEPLRGEGPLAGIPVAVKDVFVDGGRAPTMGSRVHAPPMKGTASLLSRLRSLGATVLGYTNLHEWAIGTTSEFTALGPIRNPWDLDRVAGGSSGGSAAAVAAGLVPVAIGTDAGGSVRIPAAACGIVGLKSTFGTLPLEGAVGGPNPVDHAGVFARSVGDVASFFSLLTDVTAAEVDLRSLRLGIPSSFFFENARADVRDVAEGVASRLVQLMERHHMVDVTGLESSASTVAVAQLGGMAAVLGDTLDDRPDDFGPLSLKALLRGRLLTGPVDLEPYRAVWQRVFDECDVVIVPTLPALPPRIGEPKVDLPSGSVIADLAQLALNAPMNTGGVPALAVPCGEVDGMPVSVTLVAAPHQEAKLFAAGAAVEELTEGAYRNRVAPISD